MKLSVKELMTIIQEHNIIPSKDKNMMAFAIVGELDNDGDLHTSTLFDGDRHAIGAMLASVMYQHPKLETLFDAAIRACRMQKDRNGITDPLDGMIGILNRANEALEEYTAALDLRQKRQKKANKPKK